MTKKLSISIDEKVHSVNDTARAIMDVLRDNSAYSSENKYRALRADESTIAKILSTGTDRDGEGHEKIARELHNIQERMTMEEARMLTHPAYTWVSDEGQLVPASLDLHYSKPGIVVVYDGNRLVAPEASEFPKLPSRSQGDMQFIHSLSGLRRFVGSPREALKALIELNYSN